jgi:hypothetical protein
MGVITTKKSLVQLEKLSTASFCRRRLAVVMVRLKMSETLREAATFIEQVQLPTANSQLQGLPSLALPRILSEYADVIAT